MRLLNPGTGEVTDRLTILSLKILFGREAGKDISHFEAEQTGLLAKIRTKTLNGPWYHHTLELAAVNAALWHAEDEMRDARTHAKVIPTAPEYAVAVSKVAFRIQELNDRRAELVTLINTEAGDKDGEEKVSK